MRYFDYRKILIVGENDSAKAISAVPRTFFWAYRYRDFNESTVE